MDEAAALVGAADEGEGASSSSSSSARPRPRPAVKGGRGEDGASSSSSMASWVLLALALLVSLLLVGLAILNGQQDSPRREKEVVAEERPTQVPSTAPTPDRLRRGKERAERVIEELFEYYGGEETAFTMFNAAILANFRKEGGGEMHPVDPVNFDAFVFNIARSIVNEYPFVLGFIGSSVACGHDNCYYDSFQNQLDRVFGPVWAETTGKRWTIRNSCQGGGCGDSWNNQPLCAVQYAGEDVDVLFWEWTYHQVHEEYICIQEPVLRWMLQLPKQPILMTLSAGERFDTKYAQALYGYTGVNSFQLEGALRMNGKFPGREWGKVGDGVHNTTRYGEQSTDRKRRDSLGVVYRNWHPGPLGFQFLSDVVGFYFLRGLIAAVDAIIAKGEGVREAYPQFINNRRSTPTETTKNLKDCISKRPLPGQAISSLPVFPKCYTCEKTQFGRESSIRIADNPNEHHNPYRSEVHPMGTPQGWSVKNEGPNWSLVPQYDKSLLQDLCLPPDECGMFVEPQNKSSTAPLVFRLPHLDSGFIFMCLNGAYYGVNHFYNASTFHVEIDRKQLDNSKFLKDTHMPGTQCAIILHKDMLGEHPNPQYLAIRRLKDPVRLSMIMVG